MIAEKTKRNNFMLTKWLICLCALIFVTLALAVPTVLEELGEDIKLTSSETIIVDGIKIILEKYFDNDGPYAEVQIRKTEATVSRLRLNKQLKTLIYSIVIDGKTFYSETDMNQDGKPDYIVITLSNGEIIIVKDSKFTGQFETISK